MSTSAHITTRVTALVPQGRGDALGHFGVALVSLLRGKLLIYKMLCPGDTDICLSSHLQPGPSQPTRTRIQDPGFTGGKKKSSSANPMLVGIYPCLRLRLCDLSLPTTFLTTTPHPPPMTTAPPPGGSALQRSLLGLGWGVVHLP